MKIIDIDNWSRKNHYNYFKQLDYPHFNICANIDITNFYEYVKSKNLPFFISILYLSTKVANNITEFKLRIRDNLIIEHDTVNPSFTVMTDDNLFSFCTTNFIDDYNQFKTSTIEDIEKVKKNIIMNDEPGRDDLLYITTLPWISFTSITHPIQMSPTDSIPRISWGKFFDDNGKVKIPFSVQVHHALVDGIHVGKYFNDLEEVFNNPQKYL